LRSLRLKAGRFQDDSGGVFFARQEPPDPTRCALRALRASLNTPVLVVQELPPGPASAAIACLGGPGGPRISLALRSVRSGEVVFFGPDDDPREWQGPEVALDAALSFAESMGFLFEDDRLGDDPDGARRLWRDLVEAAGREPLAGLAGAAPGDPGPEAAWLEDVAPPLAVGRGVPLTKFRRAPARAGAAPDRAAAPRPPRRVR
jgi:hypothetical protein